MKRNGTSADLTPSQRRRTEQRLDDIYSVILRPGIWALRIHVPVNAVVDDVKDQICNLVNDHTFQIYRCQFLLKQHEQRVPYWWKVSSIPNFPKWTFHCAYNN